jgi:transposase
VLNLPPTVRVFLAIHPIDMRGSFDALAGAVRRLGLDPLTGHFYVFFSRRRHIVKILCFDRSGFWVLQKRLERGTFQLPVVPEGVDRVTADGRLLTAILEGVDLRAPRRRWYGRESALGS